MQHETGLGKTSSAGSVWRTIERAITARRGAVTLVVIILLSLAFRLKMSGECSFSLDEAVTHQDVLNPWSVVLEGPSREHPPLMYVLGKLAVGVFGESETGVRSVSLFFGCVLLVAAYQLCLEYGLTVQRSLLVIGTLALSPFFIRHATEARQYAIFGTLSTLALTRTLRLLRGPVRMGDLVGFALSAAAAAWTHYFGLAYALALLGTLLIGIRPTWKQSRPWQRIALIGVIIVLIVLLGLVAARLAELVEYYTHGKGRPSAAEPLPLVNTELALDFLREFSFMTYGAWSFAIQPLLALGGLLLLTLRSRGMARVLPFGIGVAPCVAALFIASGHFIAARYLAPSGFLYHIASAIALFAALDRAREALAHGERGRLVPLAGGLVLAGLVSARLWEFPNGFAAGEDYFPGVQRYFVSNHLAKDTRLVAYFGDFGRILYGKQYRVGPAPIALEKFRPVRGINRYLVVELHVFGDRVPVFESLVAQKFGISVEAWRALPVIPLAYTRYQAAVPARLVQLSAR